MGKMVERDEHEELFTSNFAAEVDDVTVTEFIEKDNLKYMLYTVEDRAIPSVIDGLKPGQRRLLYSMYKDGVSPDAKTKKSSRLVSSATGQFHPHGDAAMYGTLVNLAVPYRRIQLIDGAGNFGQAPGATPAQDRYTEARLSVLGWALVDELKDRTVPFQPTYDGVTEEPVYLSPSFPPLAMGGAEGMAEGYATNYPAHNPQEIMQLCLAVLNNPQLSDEEVLEIVPGPDWGTGGAVVGSAAEIAKYLATGKGKLTVRGSYSIDAKRKEIVITEVPAGVTVTSIYESLREQVRSGAIEGVKDVLEGSDMRNPIKLIVQAKRGVDLEGLAKEVLRKTNLETTFGANMVALDRNRVPRWWGLKEQIVEFLQLRDEILVRRCESRLEKLRAQLIKSQALAKVLLDKETTVQVVMQAEDEYEAAVQLGKVFGLSEEQGTYVANLALKRLSKSNVLDAQRQVERKEQEITELEELLSDKSARDVRIAQELRQVAQMLEGPQYKRRTKLLHDERPVAASAEVSKDDEKRRLAAWKLDADMGILSDRGQDIPEGSIVWCVFADGRVKLFDGAGLPKTIRSKTIAPDVGTLVACGVAQPGQHLILVSSEGKVLRVDMAKINTQGLAGSGVAGMKLPEGVSVVTAAVAGDEDCLLTQSAQAWKVTGVSDIPVKGRGTAGVMVHKLRKGDEQVFAAEVASKEQSFIVNGKKAKIQSRAAVTTKGAPVR